MYGFLEILLANTCVAALQSLQSCPQVELLIRKERCASAEAQLIEVTAELGVPWHGNCFSCFGASRAWLEKRHVFSF